MGNADERLQFPVLLGRQFLVIGLGDECRFPGPAVDFFRITVTEIFFCRQVIAAVIEQGVALLVAPVDVALHFFLKGLRVDIPGHLRAGGFRHTAQQLLTGLLFLFAGEDDVAGIFLWDIARLAVQERFRLLIAPVGIGLHFLGEGVDILVADHFRFGCRRGLHPKQIVGQLLRGFRQGNVVVILLWDIARLVIQARLGALLLPVNVHVGVVQHVVGRLILTLRHACLAKIPVSSGVRPGLVALHDDGCLLDIDAGTGCPGEWSVFAGTKQHLLGPGKIVITVIDYRIEVRFSEPVLRHGSRFAAHLQQVIGRQVCLLDGHDRLVAGEIFR